MWGPDKLLFQTELGLQTRAQNVKAPLPRGFCLSGGGDVPMFEPKKWLKFKDIDKSIQELRRIFKVHPEWFEVPKPKSDRGKNIVEYSV